jgi:RluA family pseudouridine synthase
MTLDILSRLLYRDALMLVVDKPAGIPVHKGTGGGENLEQYFEALRFGLPRTPALAHRLDRDTSGCLVLGRNRHALSTLGDLFAGNKIGKTYWAIVKGRPPQAQGAIELPLEKKSADASRWHMKIAEQGGLSATTEYKVRGEAGGITWLELTPKTGRTHQLRVHCAAIGCPIIGDRIYGSGEPEGLQLHARSVIVPLYKKKEPITVEAHAPEHMRESLATCGLEDKVGHD